MSEFNYPIQIDDSTYSKTIGDYDYNRIFDYLTDNTDWKFTLDKVKNNLKLGIEDSNLNKKVYDYSLILKYFSNLSKYCRNATTTERNNLYCTFITCLETSFVCRNNPQIIRDLADLLCLPHTTTNSDCCSTYTYDIFTYDILSYTSSCTDFDNTISTAVVPVFSGVITYIPQTVDDYSACVLTQYRLTSTSTASNSDFILYKLLPPVTADEGDKFVLTIQAENTFGRDFIEQGALLDSTWDFNTSHKKEYLANYRTYLFRYINSEWYVDDVNTNKYEQITYQSSNIFNSTPVIPFHAGIEYTLLSMVFDTNVTIPLDNPIYSKGLYIKIIYTSGSNPFTVDTYSDQIVLSSGNTYEWYSDGISWILQ